MLFPGISSQITPDPSEPAFRFRPPTVEDAGAIQSLVSACPPLDVNSAYAYLLLGHHFSETCVVAECGDRLMGFLSAYRPPAAPHCLFIWQVAVHPDARRRKLAYRMMEDLLTRPGCLDINAIEMTIGPTNKASLNLFRKLAGDLHADLRPIAVFTSTFLDDDAHEDETLYRLASIRS